VLSLVRLTLLHTRPGAYDSTESESGSLQIVKRGTNGLAGEMLMNLALLNLPERIRGVLDTVVALRHDLHAHPELAFAENRTAGRVLEHLGALPNLTLRSGVGGTGVVGLLNSRRQGPCVALRADMDALPIQEATDLPYASTLPGKTHACGHDGHTAALVGAAMVLSRLADRLPGKVKFLFQPAEEAGGGAARLIDEGALDNPKVDAIFGLHGWSDVELGHVAVSAGPVMAGTRTFDLILRGTGTHAAYPHRGSDVVAAACQIVTAVHAIRTRRIDPVTPLVISICQVSAGHTYNVLPDECGMKGTIRALDVTALESAWTQVQQVAHAVADMFGVEARFELVDAYPPLVNEPGCARVVFEVGRELLGPNCVADTHAPSMGGEDFAYYCQRVPGAFLRVGVRPGNIPDWPAIHNPKYDFNDAALPTAIAMHCGVALKFLAEPPSTLCG